MRDKKRIKLFCDKFALLWETYCCDWRFGQLCSNFFGWLYQEKKKDLFFPEEAEMIKYIEEYLKGISK